MGYNYEQDLANTCRADKRRWNGKVITTAKQWQYNDDGAMAIGNYSMADIYAAFNEARENDYCMMY